MSTTTQILFNSPALHSLKRDQLVKLCKIHSLKASGKNKELIERLQFHAKTLPPDDPLSVATRSDNLDAKPAADSEDEASNCSEKESASTSDTISRPSEQWEVVMDTIKEVDEETLRSNRGASDQSSGFCHIVSQSYSDFFGTETQYCQSRRYYILHLLVSPARRWSNCRQLSPLLIRTVGSKEPAVEPIPGQSNLQGLPAPSEARLSLSQAPATTTIRLVSNATTSQEPLLSPPKLQPFATSFDLVPGTPGGTGSSSVPVWPFSPGGAARESLYPSIPTFQGFADLHTQQSSRSVHYDNSDMDIDLDMPGGLVVPSIREPAPEKANV
ncbi:hypothetical protein J3R82DRAFT_8135 [Butyriboletus roseoflavus]|nr:hypothetical protein J3R82DRAFT_8135 [Butyriboletus roseoflavus]